jgi:hypothetical protein
MFESQKITLKIKEKKRKEKEPIMHPNVKEKNVC